MTSLLKVGGRKRRGGGLRSKGADGRRFSVLNYTVTGRHDGDGLVKYSSD